MDANPSLDLVQSASRAAARRTGRQGPIERALRTLSVWIERTQQRRCLAGLSDRSLRDIGISRCEALKPFWRR